MDIKYQITFYSDWHCGSGLSAGADMDLLVIKDKNNLPFVPGKTIKGLVREALEELQAFDYSNVDLSLLLGKASKKEDSKESLDSKESQDKTSEKEKPEKSQGCCFFKNAVLDSQLQKVIIAHELQEHLYRSVASTSINEDGVAEGQSLRKMEVTVPCTLEGEILDIPTQEDVEAIWKALKYIKRLGQNRNRGLGRCSIHLPEKEEGGNQ